MNVQLIPTQLHPALCLDLDGTVRYSRNGAFVNGPDDIVLFDDVEAKLWEYRNNGWLIFGISNQGGVAFGLKSASTADAELRRTCELFNQNPFHIIKACLHHPDGGQEPWNHRSLLRKPDIGMLAVCEVEAWEKGLIVDWDNSLFVGDRPEDELCARNAGIAFQWSEVFFNRKVSA